jgi:hypothetical protein
VHVIGGSPASVAGEPPASGDTQPPDWVTVGRPADTTEGEKDNLHISIIAGRVILVVIFDQRSSLGLVRLRVKKASDELGRIFDDLTKKSAETEKGNKMSPFAEITDDDIDNLFS